jgi:hypothetical protein
MSSIPKQFTDEYYNEDYFKTPKGKKFKRPDGSIEAWSYSNPDGESLGCVPIVEAWNKIFHPKTLLDVGAGRGTIVAYARDLGIEAQGFDFSKWACTEGRYPRCASSWLKVHDATKPWPYEDQSFDLVVALDFWEHIYSDDIDAVIKEMLRVSKKWIFLEIATVGSGSGSPYIHEQGYILKKGDPIPIEREGNAVAGHVTVCDKRWWLEKFDSEDWLPRTDLVNWFFSLVPKENVKNWLLNTVIILEKL